MSGILREYSIFSQLTILVAYFADTHPNELNYITVQMKKKRSEETQTRRAGCSKAEPKKFAPPQTGRRTAKI